MRCLTQIVALAFTYAACLPSREFNVSLRNGRPGYVSCHVTPEKNTARLTLSVYVSPVNGGQRSPQMIESYLQDGNVSLLGVPMRTRAVSCDGALPLSNDLIDILADARVIGASTDDSSGPGYYDVSVRVSPVVVTYAISSSPEDRRREDNVLVLELNREKLNGYAVRLASRRIVKRWEEGERELDAELHLHATGKNVEN